MSVKEEVEQDVINKSVKVDVASQRTTASFPLINNLSFKLAHNKEWAMKLHNQHIKKLNQNIDKNIESEKNCNNLAVLTH